MAEQILRVKSFMHSLPKVIFMLYFELNFQLVLNAQLFYTQNQLSLAAFHCRAYARSLLWLEEYITQNPESLQRNIASLQVLNQ